MRILLVMGAFSFGGAERVMCTLANGLCARGDDVTLLTLSAAEETYPLSDGVGRVNGLGWKNYADGVLRIRRTLRRERPDVIVSFLTQVNIAVLLAAAGLGIPVIVSERSDPKQSGARPYRRILRRLTYPFAAGFVFQTEQARDYFSKGIRARSAVIQNPVDLSVPAKAADDRRKEIVSVGRFSPGKRQALVVETFARIAQRHSDYTLHFFGDGAMLEHVQQLSADSGMGARIVFHGNVPDVTAQIADASIFVLASDSEGFPNALAEAMGMGLACISTDCPCGGPAALIRDGENGLLIPVGDGDALAAAMERLMQDPALCRKLGKNALHVRETLAEDRILSEWRGYIESRIASRKVRMRFGEKDT